MASAREPAAKLIIDRTLTAPLRAPQRRRNLAIAAVALALFLALGGGAIVTSVLVLGSTADSDNAPPPHYIFQQEHPATGAERRLPPHP